MCSANESDGHVGHCDRPDKRPYGTAVPEAVTAFERLNKGEIGQPFHGLELRKIDDLQRIDICRGADPRKDRR